MACTVEFHYDITLHFNCFTSRGNSWMLLHPNQTACENSQHLYHRNKNSSYHDHLLPSAEGIFPLALPTPDTRLQYTCGCVL